MTMLYRDMTSLASFDSLSDGDLIAETKRLAQAERRATAALVASLAAIDARRLYLGEGCSSLFTYCTQVLHISGDAAYGRIEVARLARRFPLVLDRLLSGEITLTAASLLRPVMTADNHRALLDAAQYTSKRDVERLVATWAPRPDVPARVRKLPAAKAAAGQDPTLAIPVTPPIVRQATHEAAPSPRLDARDDSTARCADDTAGPAVRIPKPAVVVPLAPERYKVQFTVGRETHDRLRRLQDLMRHTIPTGDVAEIVDRALTLLLQQVEKSRLARADRPRTAGAAARGSRHIPAAVRRAVRQRDEDRCAFAGPEGAAASGIPGVPSRPPVRTRWRRDGGEHRVALPRAQSARG